MVNHISRALFLLALTCLQFNAGIQQQYGVMAQEAAQLPKDVETFTLPSGTRIVVATKPAPEGGFPQFITTELPPLTATPTSGSNGAGASPPTPTASSGQDNNDEKKKSGTDSSNGETSQPSGSTAGVSPSDHLTLSLAVMGVGALAAALHI